MKQSSTIDHFAWVGFKVPFDKCKKVEEYVAEYEKQEAFVNYGFPPDPLKYEGAFLVTVKTHLWSCFAKCILYDDCASIESIDTKPYSVNV